MRLSPPRVNIVNKCASSQLLSSSKRGLSFMRRNVSTQKENPYPRQVSFLQSADNSTTHILNRLADLDSRLNYQGWHTLRWTSLFVVVAGATAWLFRENVSSGVGEAASEVTKRTLENQDVQQQASTLARGVVYELLNDKRALDLASQFVNEVLQRETTKQAVLGLVQDVLSRNETEMSLRNLVSNVLTHQDSADKAVEFLQRVVAKPESRDALVKVLSAVLAQPHTQDVTSNFFQGVMHSETFTSASNRLGWDTVNYLLSNEELRSTAVSWCNSVLNDPALQNTAGEAVWNAVRGAFVPWGKGKHHIPSAIVSPPPTTTPSSHSNKEIPALASATTPGGATVIVTQQPVDAVALIQGEKISVLTNSEAPSAEEKSAKNDKSMMAA